MSDTDRKTSDRGGKQRDGGLISRYGLPAIFLSLATLIVQVQQQSFDRWQKNFEAGYLFYSSGRTSLTLHTDAERELSLLKIISRAFPDIYCRVRQDTYERAAGADVSDDKNKDGVALFSSGDQNYLLSHIATMTAPEESLLPTNVFSAFASMMATKQQKAVVKSCDPLQAQETATVAQAAQHAGSATPPVAEKAAREQGGRAADPSRAAPTVAPVGGDGDRLAPSELARLSDTVRVFAQIVVNGRRKPEDINSIRSDLEPYNYRVMQGVERVEGRKFHEYGEVRYFGVAEEAAAEQLRKYLNGKYAAERIVFRKRAIGADFPNLPHSNFELWIPDPPGGGALPNRVNPSSP